MFKIAQNARYLGVVLGLGATGERWRGPMSGFKRRVHALHVALAIPQHPRLQHIRLFCLQFRLPSTTRAADGDCRPKRGDPAFDCRTFRRHPACTDVPAQGSGLVCGMQKSCYAGEDGCIWDG
eukprot:4752499-Pyramimonas_sp.AAC.1